MRRVIEILLLLLASCTVFFWDLSHDFIKTEGLRTIVVKEMLERDGLSMPTVHQAPYLRKPPLYAWTVTSLSRAVNRFDETLTRLPSAVAGVLFVLLAYLLGEVWLGRGVGFAAGTFALLTPTVMDYGGRAELDLPFALLCSGGIAVGLSARQHGRATTVLAWIVAYLLILLAAMWKGPHSLIFLWLALLGQTLLTRDFAFLRQPAQWLGLTATLTCLLFWTRALSVIAGPSQVGLTAGQELLVRLVPYRSSHLVGMLTFLPWLLLITLPGSIFTLLLHRRDVRDDLGWSPLTPSSYTAPNKMDAWRDGWRRLLAARPGLPLIAAWLLPNFVFMLIAPAKAARYSLPVFLPVLLTGALIAVGTQEPADAKLPWHRRRVWFGVFVMLALAGLFGIVRFVGGLAGQTLGVAPGSSHWPWLALGIGGVMPLLVEWPRGGRSGFTRCVMLLVFAVGMQPVLHGVYWLRREAKDSRRATMAEIESLVPEGAVVFVLGRRPYHDLAIYASRRFAYAATADEALAKAGGERAWAVLRASEADELLEGAQAVSTKRLEFGDPEEQDLLIEVRPPTSP